MDDRFRKDGEPPLPGDNPDLETDSHILMAHLFIVAVLGAIALWLDWSIPSLAFGFILGVALLSLFWRWRYGHWPD